MSKYFEELDYQQTPIGAISLRRRHDFRLGKDILEIMLGDEHLMSDLFTTSEIALATLGLAYHRETGGPPPRDIVIGGLGLGNTAEAVLQDNDVTSLLVVDALQPIIDWHEQNMLPLGAALSGDSRCQFICADFFATAAGDTGFDPAIVGRRFDAILVDIDHTPDFHLAPGNEGFYTAAGLTKLQQHLTSEGVFGLWSNDPPDEHFTAHLQSVFANARAEAVSFSNPFQDGDVTQTIYLARRI